VRPLPPPRRIAFGLLARLRGSIPAERNDRADDQDDDEDGQGDLILRWIEEGRRRAAQARKRPFGIV
jgi:hypothetical protein